MIEIKNVTKTYSGKPALSQVNLTLPGEKSLDCSAKTVR